MNLRLRLIVAFFLLSVVPLAAVTAYTYTTNAAAVRQAASREAELLAGELTQRMQLVTAQLSDHLEHLMDVSAEPAAVQPSADASHRVATASAEAATAAGIAASASQRTTAETLGDLAMIFNNVEVRGTRGFGGGGRAGGRGRGGPGGPGGPGGGPTGPNAFNDQPGTGRSDFGRGGGPRAGSAASVPVNAGPSTPAASSTGNQSVDASRGAGPDGQTQAAQAVSGPRLGPDPSVQNGRGGGFRGRPPFDPNAPGGATAPPNAGPPASSGFAPLDQGDDPSRIRIDMMPIRREIMQQFATEEQWQTLTDEQRQRIIAEVNQRMLGIEQGIKMGAVELQKRVVEAQKVAEDKAREVAADARAKSAAATKRATDAAAAAASGNAAPAPTAPTPPRPPASPVAAAAPVAAVAPPAAASSIRQRHTTMSGTRLDVTVERNGEVVGQVNGDINLPYLLATVFTTTRRDRGEVPFAVGKDGTLYTQTAADRKEITALGSAVTKPDSAPGTLVLGDSIVVTTADPTGSGLKFGIVRPVGGSLNDLRRSTARNTAFGLGFICLALIGIVPLSSGLTRSLWTLSEGVRRIANGDYRARVQVGSHDEVGKLAAAFNVMAADIEQHQRDTVEKERIKRELELGRQIQHDMLPRSPLRLGLTEIKGVSVPAREVGGDFFNYFVLDSGEIALLVGDVSGKGVGAALLMANLQASLRTRLALGQDLASLAQAIDVDIESSTPGPVYATLFVGIFDPLQRVIRFVNAGHNPQYVVRRSGSLDRMVSSGLPVGLLAGRGYAEQRLQLEEGDLLFFYTDGCVEAENEAGEMFTAERLEATLSASPTLNADDLLARVEAEVSGFRGRREAFDDATMMVVKVG